MYVIHIYMLHRLTGQFPMFISLFIHLILYEVACCNVAVDCINKHTNFLVFYQKNVKIKHFYCIEKSKRFVFEGNYPISMRGRCKTTYSSYSQDRAFLQAQQSSTRGATVSILNRPVPSQKFREGGWVFRTSSPTSTASSFRSLPRWCIAVRAWYFPGRAYPSRAAG